MVRSADEEDREAAAHRAVDEILTAGRPRAARIPDDTYRVRCSRCGKSV